MELGFDPSKVSIRVFCSRESSDDPDSPVIVEINSNDMVHYQKAKAFLVQNASDHEDLSERDNRPRNDHEMYLFRELTVKGDKPTFLGALKPHVIKDGYVEVSDDIFLGEGSRREYAANLTTRNPIEHHTKKQLRQESGRSGSAGPGSAR